MVDELRGEADQHQRRVRELEEHIQSDNRAEKLEEFLRNTQERADEFEFQLSKLKQVGFVCSLYAHYVDISCRHMVP
jgi:myosin protein heavy chain